MSPDSPSASTNSVEREDCWTLASGCRLRGGGCTSGKEAWRGRPPLPEPQVHGALPAFHYTWISGLKSAHVAAQAVPDEDGLDEIQWVLTDLDSRLISTLRQGDIRLLRPSWVLQQPSDYRVQRRQDLEALERAGATPSPLLTSQEAVSLVRRGVRAVGVISYGWLSPGEPPRSWTWL